MSIIEQMQVETTRNLCFQFQDKVCHMFNELISESLDSNENPVSDEDRAVIELAKKKIIELYSPVAENLAKQKIKQAIRELIK